MTTPVTLLLDLTPADALTRLDAWCLDAELPPYRARQMHRRLWQAPIASWQEATELPLALRQRLDLELPLSRLEIEVVRESADGTRKFLFQLHDGERIESVLIPSGTRRTLCISSQAGCALRCAFCATGTMGFRRHLAVHEIAGQVREIVLHDPTLAPTNIVFMGMGEPLLNWEAVDTTLTILNDPHGFGIGARHITVSTVGIIPGMQALAARPEQFRLAISLHAPHHDQRIALMPIERKYPLTEVLAAAQRDFPRRVTLEYVLIAGRNDHDEDAIALGTMAQRLGAHVNLLPLHVGGAPTLTATPPPAMRAFRDLLTRRGVEAVIRRSRGLDIEAACGQLRVVQEARRATASAARSTPPDHE